MIRQRVEDIANHARFASIIDQWERGEGLDRIEPLDAVSALAWVGLNDDPPLVQEAPKRPQLLRWASEPAIASWFPRASRPNRLAASAGLLQILDFWGASHEAAQEADDLGESSFSPYWHAIAHRREPDFGNAAYWFRRVGRHPVLTALAEAIPQSPGHLQSQGLIKNGVFDPSAFAALCGLAIKDESARRFALDVQRMEMVLLLDATAKSLAINGGPGRDS